MKFLLITLSLVMSFQLHARHRVGNGGDVVVCQNGSVQTVELLDSYESREIYGNELKLPAGKNELEVALALIERMKDVAPGRLNVVREFKDGRIILNSEGSLVVPHIGIEFISYLESVMDGLRIVLNSPELVVGEEEIHFSTDTHITIKKNGYDHDTWDVTGKIRARKGIHSDTFKEHFLVIDALLSYEFPGFWGQGYFTGWAKSIWCLEEDEAQPKSVRILNLDYTDYYEHNDTQVISYDLAEAIRLTNDFMNVFIERGTSVRDNRASQTSCETNSYAAKSMSFKASGDVKTADGWVKVRDDLIFVDFVKKEVSVLGY